MILAFTAVVALLVLLPGRLEPERVIPTSVGTGPEDFLAFTRTLEALGIGNQHLLSTYGNLPDPAAHALVTLAPAPPSSPDERAAVRMDAAQIRALRAWVESGGAWLLALPHGRGGSEDEPWGDAWSEPKGSTTDEPAALVDALPPTTWIDANGVLEGHGELAGIRQRFAARSHLAGEWPAALRREQQGPARTRVFAERPAEWTSLLELAGHPVALSRRFGAGTLLLVSSPLVFENLALGALGTGESAVRLAHRLSDAGRRTILIDEFAHGISHDRGLWWIARRHGFGGLLLALVALLTIVAWRGAVRRAPALPADTMARRSSVEFVVALANIARRAGRSRSAAAGFVDGQELLARRRGDREAVRQLAALRARTESARDLASFRKLARDVDVAVGSRIPDTSPVHGASS
jgi:hypothetical protein